MADAYKDIGHKLKLAREAKNLTMEDISEETKVSEEYLEAIEAGQIDAFPSNVYYDMFTRSYAKELEIDPEELFEDLKIHKEQVFKEKNTEEETVEKAEADNTEKKKEGSSLIKLAIWLSSIVIVIFIALVIWMIMSKDNSEADMSDAKETPVHEAEQSANEPEMQPVKDKIDIDLPEYEPIKEMTLEVLTRDSCWVMVLADGDTVLNRNLPPNAVRTLSAEYRFMVSAGNPNALEIKLDGVLLNPLSDEGRPYRDREINQLNKNDYLAKPEEPAIETP